MHEAHFAEQIVQAILSQLKPMFGSRPRRIVVGVGEMLHLESESVRFHYDCCVRGTSLEKVALELKEIPVQVHCKECGQKGPVEDHHMPLCTQCGSRELSMLQGTDVIIERIEA